MDIYKKQLEPYLIILNLLEEHSDKNKIVKLSQNNIADMLGAKQVKISKKMKDLYYFGAIELVAARKYKILHNDFEHTPYTLIKKLLKFRSDLPNRIGDYNFQSEYLKVEKKYIFLGWELIRRAESNKI